MPTARPFRPAARRCLVLLAFGLAASAQAASYPPELRFRTISSERAAVHYHQGLEALARQAAALVDEILPLHEQRYGVRVGRVQVVLSDADDESNGFASAWPYPLVTLRAVAPDGSDSFGNHEGWLRLALSHELAHVVHLEQARGIWGLGRKVFGRAPFLFPNALAMSWMIEGLATYEETRLTAFGRGRNADSRAVLRMAALEGRFPTEDRAVYALDAWPAGQTSYLFGEAFLEHLSEQAGEDAAPRLARHHSGQLLPYLDGRSVRKVAGRGLHGSWKAWADGLAAAARNEASSRGERGLTAARALTTRGIRQLGPRFSPDGTWIAYTSGTLARYPQIRLVRPDGSEDRVLAWRNGGSSLAWTPDGRALVFAEMQVHRTFSVFGDLSELDLANGRAKRLTRGLRARDPDVSPDGGAIVFVRKLGDRSELFTVGRDGRDPRPLTASEAGVEWSGPRFSPRGDRIAASRLLPGGWLDVVLVDAATGAVEPLTHDRARDVEPSWLPDGGAVVFGSDRDGISNIYAMTLADRRLLRLTNVLGGASQPSISPDGRSVAFASYSSRGDDVAVAALDVDAAPAAEPFLDRLPPPRPDPVPAAGASRPYRPSSLLVPRFWSPWVESRDREARLGAATGGSDALLRHVWFAQAAYGSETRRPSATAYYLYDRFRVSLLASAQDTSDALEQGRLRRQRLAAQASLPIRRGVRSLASLSFTLRREREWREAGEGESRAEDLGGIETALTISTAKTYPYSISPIDGGQWRLAWLHEARGLGSDHSYDRVTADARYYTRLFGSRDVLAARLAAGSSFGRGSVFDSCDENADTGVCPFAVGGYPDASLLDLARTNVTVLRGYADNQFRGRRFGGANLEYRFPLASPQRGWRTLPVFIRHLRGAVFLDAAEAWSASFRWRDVRTAAGASLGVDSALGYALPASAEVAVARALGAGGETRVYLRFGLAF